MTDTEKKAQPPLSTRECADFMGVSTTYIVEQIKAGKLPAERVPSGPRTLYRVHEDDFVAFLKAVKWSRLPGGLQATGTD
jgi:excisionase family DNA binding protein